MGSVKWGRALCLLPLTFGPAFAPVPALALKVLYGEMSVIVTTGQRALPKRLQEAGYSFRRPDLEDALRDATGSRRTPAAAPPEPGG